MTFLAIEKHLNRIQTKATDISSGIPGSLKNDLLFAICSFILTMISF